MSNGPIANYVYSPWKDRPGREVGFDAVGAGWKHILEQLDDLMVNVIENAASNATKALPEFRDAENTAQAAVEIVQIKEKFGGLRVYHRASGMSKGFAAEINGAIRLAERFSYITCEECGSRQEVETRTPKGTKWGRTLTLCASCHKERDDRHPTIGSKGSIA